MADKRPWALNHSESSKEAVRLGATHGTEGILAHPGKNPASQSTFTYCAEFPVAHLASKLPRFS